MIKTIFLDLDDTLLDFTGGEAHALSRALGEMGVTPTPAILERYHVINASQWELLEEGVHYQPANYAAQYRICSAIRRKVPSFIATHRFYI